MAIIAGCVYIIVLPIILRLLAMAQRKLVVDRYFEKHGKSRETMEHAPKPIWIAWKERLSFTMKDKRTVSIGKKNAESEGGIQNRIMFFLIWAFGLVATVVPVYLEQWVWASIGPVLFMIAIIFGIASANSVIKARHRMYERMFEIAQNKLGLRTKDARTPQEALTVMEWGDILTPRKIRFKVPTTFGEEGEEGFLRMFNQLFGQVTAWVVYNDPESGKPGWDYEEGFVTIRSVPPLPTMAPWDERYVLNEGIAWSFFPLALGVEDGVELVNPETGEPENVLGFDVAGEQGKVGNKAGISVAGNIVSTPHSLIAGSSGGGKSLSIETMVAVVTPEQPALKE